MDKNKIKEHLNTHRTEYIFAGALLSGIVIGKLVYGKPTMIITNTATASPVINTAATAAVTNGGYMHKIVKCLETGQIWETVKDAAEAMGSSSSTMSKHLNGHTDCVNDLHFTIVGLGAGV